MNFEEALNRLEQLVRQLENGQIALEEALELFAEGVKLAKFCAGQLEQAEKKIAQLLTDEQGQQVLIPIEDLLEEGEQS